MNEEQNDLNQDNNTQPIPQFIINSGLDVTFHGAHSNGEIQVETSLLSNGIYGIILTSCIPMIMGTGGNAGGRAAAAARRQAGRGRRCGP